MARQPVRIGARGSKLSLAQAGLVRAAIAARLGDDAAAVIVPITTSGDREAAARLADIGGKGLFTKEIEATLLAGDIDCAVHSLKDMPTADTPGLAIAAVPEREDARDAFVSGRFAAMGELPRGARLGTSSLRRAAQARFSRPDLAIVPLRGNVDTRLAKLDGGEAEAILLAAAGLKRLGLVARARSFIDPRQSPPAPGQGALAVQTREADTDAPWLAGLDSEAAALSVTAERGALAALEGSCRTAVGAHAWIEGGRLKLIVEALTPDGARRFRRAGETEVSRPAAAALGERLGGEVAAEGGAALFV
ncbi:MAG TPA: hydroxymethylbilane synthase [Caulobacteraceae bacterium]|nr:hydroxymethylbilane synthase [Caulobacteraceae bacterium]